MEKMARGSEDRETAVTNWKIVCVCAAAVLRADIKLVEVAANLLVAPHILWKVF